MSTIVDEETDFGARAAAHLRDAVVVWLTTVTPSGAPLPMPVWFAWDGADSVTIYSQPGARLRNLESNGRVTLNFDGDGTGGDIVVLSGHAVADPSAPPADQNPDYVAKYDGQITRIGLTPETFAKRYSMAVVIQLRRLRGH